MPAAPAMLAAAGGGRRDCGFAVTVLTSLDADRPATRPPGAGSPRPRTGASWRRAGPRRVCARRRKPLGAALRRPFLIVTWNSRRGDAVADQRRTATARQALAAGADLLVSAAR
jgi:hypothetical protein